MTKVLTTQSKLSRPERETKYFNKSTLENRSKYKKQKNVCSKLYKNEREKFYSNLKLSDTNDNRTFW